ncbi:hypothetical protein HS041_28270 [Planomonospora sp. ID67723]|uniref:hypothetical protein n=1 Tax=Planomonospora sp. ID67723 TaxID=2738134 RepID=UPI0018C3E86E|nr:hypothetical protein [Planomonospora sp. ID67723]MBG0831630.1 hypothetical protein [Planomonospora sp. ID67723]
MVTLEAADCMPRAARNARVVMTLQSVFGALAIVMLSIVLVGTLDTPAQPEGSTRLLLLSLGLGTALTALTSWLVLRWDSRKRGVWSAALLLQSLLALFAVAGVVFDPASGITDLLGFNFVTPVIVTVLLLLPSVRAWFDR